MKVLYVHHNPDKGGSSNSLRYLLEELPEDVDIHISSPEGIAFERFKKITPNLYPSSIPPILFTTSGVKLGWLRLLLALRGVKSFNKELEKTLDLVKPDIVHLNEIALISVADFCKKKGYKVVMHARVVAHHQYKRYTKYASKVINRSVDNLICIDGSVSHVLPDVKRKSIVYNPLQVSDQVFQKDKHEGLNVFFLASFLKQKGIIDVLNTAVRMKSEPGVQFLIAGGNLKPESFYNSALGRILHITGIYPNIQKKIEATIKKHDLKNVTLLGYLENINQKLQEADVLLLPTHMNEPSRSVFEAGMFGIPTILTLRDKVEDLVEDGVTGIIAKEKDTKAIAEALIKLRDNPELLKKLGEASKERFSRLNSRENAVSRMYKIYQAVHKNEPVVLPEQ